MPASLRTNLRRDRTTADALNVPSRLIVALKKRYTDGALPVFIHLSTDQARAVRLLSLDMWRTSLEAAGLLTCQGALLALC